MKQEVMLYAFLKIHDFRGATAATFLAWLTKITEQQVKMTARYFHSAKRDSRREISLDAASDDEARPRDSLVDKAPPPEEIAAANETREFLKQEIQQYWKDRQQPEPERDWREEKLQDYAFHLGISANDVRNIRYRIRRKLEEKKAKEDSPPPPRKTSQTPLIGPSHERPSALPRDHLARC
jgi:DNA-directed RNA polymerase specialized sigma24 family protein